MSEKFKKFILSALGVLTTSILVGYLVFAWNEPSQAHLKEMFQLR
jgi:hypothetical protein